MLLASSSLLASFVCVLLYFIQIGSPKSQIITQKLHDSGGVTVLVFFETIEVSDRVVKRLLCVLARNVWVVQDFVVEHRVVQCEAEADRVGALQVLSFIDGSLVGVLRVLNRLFAPKRFHA